MSLDLASYEERATRATSYFWQSREEAARKQRNGENADAGERSAVTAGRNMQGFIDLVQAVVEANGLPTSTIHRVKRVVTLPGFFRPTKEWDLLVVNRGNLVAAIEFKSQVGPSFGNNFNNRVEEALGSAFDLWTAHREGAFQSVHRPFLGYLMLLEDCQKSRTPVRARSIHFPVLPEYERISYAGRYELLCRKLVQEGIYTSACLILSPKEGGKKGAHSDLGSSTSLRSFVTALAGHVAASAAV